MIAQVTLAGTLEDLLATLSNPDVWLRVALSLILLVLILAMSRWQSVRLERSLVLGFAKGFVQVLAVGAVLTFIFELDDLWILYIVLGVMCLYAAWENSRMYPYPKVFPIQVLAITSTSLAVMSMVIATTFIPGVEGIIGELTGEFVIPTGSMVISYAMRISAITLERAKADIMKTRGQVDAALALGATPGQAVQWIHRDAYRSAIIPTINRVSVLGIGSIPGLMAGLIIGGMPPVEAAIYQFIVFLMLLSASFAAAIITNKLFIRQFFTPEMNFDMNFVSKMQQLSKRKKKK